MPSLVRNAEHRNAVSADTRWETQGILQLSMHVWADVSDLLLVHLIYNPSTLQLQINAVSDDESSGVTN